MLQVHSNGSYGITDKLNISLEQPWFFAISTEAVQDHVNVEVQDQGMGVAYSAAYSAVPSTGWTLQANAEVHKIIF